MILFKVRFGKAGVGQRDEREELIHEYLASMFHAGQAYGEYYICSTRGILNAYIPLAGLDAFENKYHSQWGRKAFQKLVDCFGQAPKWQQLDDQALNNNISWHGASFLYLYTHAFDIESPVCRGDDGSPIPVHILPLTFQEKDRLYAWRASYREHDSIWLDSGALEKAAYKQLSNPASELSLEGRDLCRRIEKKAKIVTYYYLMHFSLKGKDVRQADCPVCGINWEKPMQADRPNTFFSFDFQCYKCRLVANI